MLFSQKEYRKNHNSRERNLKYCIQHQEIIGLLFPLKYSKHNPQNMYTPATFLG